ncbi:MAG TPA: hypothetical protein VFD58_05375 [Blastocatellia bacterium]|nr:hypothetical protein [Blastocatellia bacterium]
MSIEMARDVLFWCALMNFALLAMWSLLFVLLHERLYRLGSRWFRLPPEQFDAVNYAAIVLYEIGVFLFNLVPYVALRIVGV